MIFNRGKSRLHAIARLLALKKNAPVIDKEAHRMGRRRGLASGDFCKRNDIVRKLLV